MELREVGAGRKEIAVRGEADVPKGDHKALKRLRDVILVGATARGPMGQAAASEGNHPGPHVVPDGRHTSVVCNVVVGRRVIEGVDVDMKEGAVPSKATGEGSKVEGIYVDMGEECRASRCAEGLEAGIDDEVIKSSEGVIAQSRSDGAEKVTQARPDAKADEEISLIRGIRAGIIGEKEAVKDRDEGGGLFRRSENNRFDVGVSANGAAEDRVAWGDGRAITSQNGICFRLEGGESGIAKEADRGTKDLCHSRAGDGVGEGGAIDGLFARPELEARGDEGGVEDGGFGRGRGGGRGGGSKEEEDFVSHRRWAEDMDIIAVGNEHASLAKEGLDKAEDGVESEGKELGSEGAALSCA